MPVHVFTHMSRQMSKHTALVRFSARRATVDGVWLMGGDNGNGEWQARHLVLDIPKDGSRNSMYHYEERPCFITGTLIVGVGDSISTTSRTCVSTCAMCLWHECLLACVRPCFAIVCACTICQMAHTTRPIPHARHACTHADAQRSGGKTAGTTGTLPSQPASPSTDLFSLVPRCMPTANAKGFCRV